MSLTGCSTLPARVAPPVSDDLMARIMADADAAVVPMPDVATSAPEQGGWRGWVAAIGGWPAMGGLALATVVGVAIGISPPAGLTSITSGFWARRWSCSCRPMPIRSPCWRAETCRG